MTSVKRGLSPFLTATATSIEAIRASLSRLDARCEELMAGEEIGSDAVEIAYSADVCYVGQSHYLEVSVDLRESDPLAGIYRRFMHTHEQVFGYSTESPARIVNLRSVHRVASSRDVERAAEPESSAEPIKCHREVIFEDASRRIAVPVYDRAALAPSDRIEGPAVIEQADTTTVVHPAWSVEVIDGGHLILTKTT